MGTFDHLDHCLYCGNELSGFTCTDCNVDFVMEDDKLIERGLSRRANDDVPERRCIACDSVLTHRAELTMAWELGDNENAYITCQDCRHQNDF